MLLVRQDAAYGSMERGAAVDAAIESADDLGLPVFDRVLETPWQRGTSVEADYDALLDRVGPGRNYMALHFNQPGEIAAIESPHSVRTEEYALFRSERMASTPRRLRADWHAGAPRRASGRTACRKRGGLARFHRTVYKRSSAVPRLSQGCSGGPLGKSGTPRCLSVSPGWERGS